METILDFRVELYIRDISSVAKVNFSFYVISVGLLSR